MALMYDSDAGIRRCQRAMAMSASNGVDGLRISSMCAVFDHDQKIGRAKKEFSSNCSQQPKLLYQARKN